jgi:hypothetical protein
MNAPIPIESKPFHTARLRPPYEGMDPDLFERIQRDSMEKARLEHAAKGHHPSDWYHLTEDGDLLHLIVRPPA